MTFGKQGIARKAVQRAAVVLCGTATAAMLAGTPAFADAPAISVDPASGLSDGQTVSVTGSGFLAGDAVAAVQCTRPADPHQISCDYADAGQSAADAG